MLKFNHFCIILFFSLISFSYCLTPHVLNSTNSKFNQTVNGAVVIVTQKHTKSLDKAFSTAYITIKSNQTCNILDGISPGELEKTGKFGSLFRKHFINKLMLNNEACDTYVFVPLFKDYYIEIDVKGDLEVEYHFNHVDFKLVVICILAFILHFEAERISKNVAFYYASGISMGLIASTLILLVILWRIIPRKKIASLAFLTGSSVMLYLTKWMYHNFKTVIESFQVYLIGYVALSVLISALYLYSRGPITNPRTFKIIEFFLKLIAYTLLYCAISYKEMFISFIIAVSAANMLLKLKSITLFKRLKHRFFPPVRRLLTEEEYIKEGHDFTIQSLKELSTYCHSPECDSWKIISRLKNPERFAKFIMNEEPHINETELYEHEKLTISNDLIDDDCDNY